MVQRSSTFSASDITRLLLPVISFDINVSVLVLTDNTVIVDTVTTSDSVNENFPQIYGQLLPYHQKSKKVFGMSSC